MKLFNKFSFSFFRFPVFLLAICSVFFWPLIFKGKIPIPADTIIGMYHPWRDVTWDNFYAGVPFKNYLITDPVRQQYIWKKLSVEQYKLLQWPLWNPYTHSGMPLLANFQTGAFYPLNLIFFILPFNLAWGIYIFFQPLLTVIFMYFFLNQLGIKKIASFFGSLIFAFCGFSVAWLEWGNIGHTILWLPLILLSIEKIIEKKNNTFWPFLFIFALTSQFFAGHLQTSFYVIIFSLIYLFFRFISTKSEDRSRFLLIFPAFYLLFILITAIQWLPTLELIKNSAREIDQISILQRKDWFLPLKHLVQLIVPDFFGNPATLNYWGEWNYGEFVSFIGVIPLFFVIFSFFYFKNNLFIKFFTLCFFGFLTFALPTPWAKLPFIYKIPFLDSAQPSRIIGLIDFCLAVLAAFGFHFFLIKKEIFSKKIIFIIMILLLAIFSLWIFVILAGNFYSQADWIPNLSVSKRNLIFPSLIFALFLLLMLLRLIFRNYFWEKIIISFLCFLSIVDLFRFFTKFIPFSPQEWIFPKTKTIEFLERDQSLFRFASIDRRIFPSNFAAAYKLSTISGYDPLYLQDYARLVTKIESGKEDIASFNRIIEPANFNSKIIDELGVKYVLSLEDLETEKLKKVFQEGETRVYENLKSEPRIKFISGDEVKLQNLNYSENKATFDIKTDKNQDLVLADMYYPGWKAKINGQEVKIQKTESNFKEIKLLEGNNIIEFFYYPKSFKVGLWLFYLGIILFLSRISLHLCRGYESLRRKKMLRLLDRRDSFAIKLGKKAIERLIQN